MQRVDPQSVHPNFVMLNSFVHARLRLHHPTCRIAGSGVHERAKPQGRSRSAGTGREAKWALKRVQGDGVGGLDCSFTEIRPTRTQPFRPRTP